MCLNVPRTGFYKKFQTTCCLLLTIKNVRRWRCLTMECLFAAVLGSQSTHRTTNCSPTIGELRFATTFVTNLLNRFLAWPRSAPPCTTPKCVSWSDRARPSNISGSRSVSQNCPTPKYPCSSQPHNYSAETRICEIVVRQPAVERPLECPTLRMPCPPQLTTNFRKKVIEKALRM